MAFSDHFSSVAKNYAAYRPTYPDALFTWLTQITPHHKTAWDCACGNGQTAKSLAHYFQHVIATDASETQIAAAVPCENIEYRVATAEASGLADCSLDLATVSQALHWFKIDDFYKEIKRVLKPQGILAVWGYGWIEAENESISRSVDQFQKIMLAPYWPPERKLVDEHYRTIAFPFREITAPIFPMEVLWTLEDILGYFRSWSAIVGFIDKHGYDPVDEIKHTLDSLWGDPDTRRSFKWPLFMRVGQV